MFIRGLDIGSVCASRGVWTHTEAQSERIFMLSPGGAPWAHRVNRREQRFIHTGGVIEVESFVSFLCQFVEFVVRGIRADNLFHKSVESYLERQTICSSP